jgi:hypothetical protein
MMHGLRTRQRAWVVFTATLLLAATSAIAQQPITYQGQLQQAGQPFDGETGMVFRLYDSVDGDNQIGEAEVFSSVEVTDGLFQVELDFGAGAFDGGARYLEIEVAGTVLGRQRITAAPVAEHALAVADGSVGSAQIAPGAVGSAQLANDTLTIASGTGLTGGGTVALGEATTIGIADGGVGENQVDSSQIQLRITGSCAPGTTLTGINADGGVECSALPAPPIGLDFTADSEGNVGAFTAIAIRDSGLPIISYYSYDAGGALKVYDCADAACSTGTSRALDESGDVGRYTAVAIRDSGLPIISYRDSSSDDLKIYDCADAACSTGTDRILDDAGNVGRYTAIAIRDNGLPIISYYDGGASDLKVYDCVDVACSDGTDRTLDDVGIVGLSTAIAIRDSGLPIISYYDSSGALKVYDCQDRTCSVGTGRTLDDDGIVGLDSGIAIRDSGLPIISYWDVANGALKVYDCADAACSGTGTARTLDDAGGNFGGHTSIAIRDSGRPIISYHDDTNGSLKVYDCSNAACSTGAARTLDDALGTFEGFPAIAIRDSGRPIISYHDETNIDLKVYSCGDADCRR